MDVRRWARPMRFRAERLLELACETYFVPI
jgi:hypothetical protein